MKPGRRLFFRLLLGVLLLFLVFSCQRRASPPPASDHLFVLTANGAFTPVDDVRRTPAVPFVPWPHQDRVTDILSVRGKAYLAVNGHGLAVAALDHGEAVISRYYEPEYFTGRTLTRLFPRADEMWCHVYRDTAFPESGPVPARAARFGLLRVTLDDAVTAYEPRTLMFQKEADAWETVGVGAIDRDKLVVEWKLAERDKSRFRYSTFTLSDGAEEEVSREWFYGQATVAPIAEAAEPVAGALMRTVADRLAAATPGCVALFSVVDGPGGADRRYLFRDDGVPGRSASAYYTVRMTRYAWGSALLLEDGGFILARSPAPSEWTEGRLPVLPAGYRYTVLAVCSGWLCVAWEQIDFYRVGRAGVVILSDRANTP